MGTIACDGWQEIKPKNVCSAIKFVTSSVTECCIDDCYYILKPVQTYIMKQTEI